MTPRARAAVVAMAGGATVTVGGSLLTWVRSGGVGRNSYDIFRLVGRLGFAPDGPASTALRWWPLMPLLAVLGVVTAWWSKPRAGGVIGAVAAVYAGAVAVAVIGAPAEGVVEIGAGPVVSGAGAAVLLAGSAAAIAVSTTDPAAEGRRAARRGSRS